MARMIECNESLAELELSAFLLNSIANNIIMEEGFEAIVEAMQKNRTLKLIHFCRC